MRNDTDNPGGTVPGRRVEGRRQQEGLRGILFLSSALLAVFVLAMGIGEVKLRPGGPLPVVLRQWTSALHLSGRLPLPSLSGLLDFLITFTLWVVLPISFLYFLVSRESRRHFFRTLRTMIGVLTLVILIRAVRGQRFLLGENLTAAGGQAISSLVPPDFVLDPPRWVGLVVSLVISVLLVLIAGVILRRFARPPTTDSGDVAHTAQEALDRLSLGEDLRGVIVQCYAEMSRVVRSTRKVRRRPAMTPREFQTVLIGVGLPPQEVGRLTGLFEEVRYGARVFGQPEEAEAAACLRAIVAACEAKA